MGLNIFTKKKNFLPVFMLWDPFRDAHFDIEIIQKIKTLRLVSSMIIRSRYFFSQPIFRLYSFFFFPFSIKIKEYY